MKVLLLVIGVVMLVATTGAAGDRVSLRVRPTVSFAPANLVVHTTVEPNPDNRALELIADAPGFFRSSEIQLDGANAPRTTLVQLRGLPTGEYAVRAVLKGVGNRQLAFAQVRVNVTETAWSPQR